MKTKTELLRRACLWVALVEGPVGVLYAVGSQDSRVAFNLLPLYLLTLPVLLPGEALVRALDLVGGGGFNPPPDPHPVAGAIVGFGASALFWVALLWFIFIRVDRAPGCPAKPGTSSPKDSVSNSDDDKATPPPP